jgi:hypothetical protein
MSFLNILFWPVFLPLLVQISGGFTATHLLLQTNFSYGELFWRRFLTDWQQ